MSDDPRLSPIATVTEVIGRDGNHYFRGQLGGSRLFIFKRKGTDQWTLFVKPFARNRTGEREETVDTPKSETIFGALAKKFAK